ncbi:phosphoserine phosphatase [Kribbella orskensis]|uniref:Phosphoserine phosphatase n=1 Tax=Kribbella orskensis TaxID=2512216 RepID=A0ABY2B9X9_9ACTN|nr:MULTISPECIES: HAD family hydrolase [Kribbella]TCN31699.1 phosphoserine phosphatase [Kribbella sp. VKM Ac-2500]TCO12295.1 phosphoserine phosphatase [Kribbella orskensis]
MSTEQRSDTHLSSWNDTPTRQALVDYVDRAIQEGGALYVPPSERIAVFDNDGTLWCEKPMPPELGFVLQRLAEMAEQDPSLRTRQPWQAAREKDYAWLGGVLTKHYHGDDSDVKVLLGGILQAFATVSVDTYAELAERFLLTTHHPTLGRRLRDCAYLPMVELLHYLEANGFTTYIASGGDRDFMRPVTSEIYGIPAERVIGSSAGLRYQEDDSGGSLVYQAEMDVFDDGPMKPVRIWSRTGQRPVIAGGNSNGDIPMLQYAGLPSRPGLRMLILHDDEEREFSYTSGAETSLERARAQDWTVVSVKNDWATVFAEV